MRNLNNTDRCVLKALVAILAAILMTGCATDPTPGIVATVQASIPTPVPTSDIPAIVRQMLPPTATTMPTPGPTSTVVPTPDVLATVLATIPTPRPTSTAVPTPDVLATVVAVVSTPAPTPDVVDIIRRTVPTPAPTPAVVRTVVAMIPTIMRSAPTPAPTPNVRRIVRSMIPATPTPIPTAIDIARQVMPSVLYLESYNSGRFLNSGTGFVTGHTGTGEITVQTNEHVVAGADSVEVRSYDTNGRGKTYEGTVIAACAVLDLAQVSFDPGRDRFTPLTFADESYAYPYGSRLAVIGYPGGSARTITEGILSSHLVATDPNGNRQEFIMTDAAINPGNSGGPIVSIETGRVIGIATWKTTGLDVDNQGFGIPVETWRHWSDSCSVPPLE